MNFFRAQDDARRSTGRLVILFLLAVLSLIVMTNLLVMFVFGYIHAGETGMANMEQLVNQIDWQVFFTIGAAVLLLVLTGSLYKILSLAGGGARVAEMLDAELVVHGGSDFRKRRLLNIVEEMALASGTPVPPVYLLDEDAINAFAAGYKPGDAIIGVTRGAIEQLGREQLQGVIAHEFSHILNGDMRLNIRLIGLLHGILLIGMIGYYILRSLTHGRRSKGSGGAVILGLGLVVIGYAGTFFGNLIKAAVSRQREFLADASAVQFTRNPDGIAGALKRIGGTAAGSILENPSGMQISHALFSQGIKTWLGSLYATHPPLEQRIYRIQPHWDGKFDYKPPADSDRAFDRSTTAPQSAARPAITMAAVAAAMTGAAMVDQVGQPTPSHLHYARTLMDDLPAEFKAAVNDPYGARAVLYFLLLARDRDVRGRQLAFLRSAADPGVYEETSKLALAGRQLTPEYRLPLLDIALASLRQLSARQYELFRQNMNRLIEIDRKVSLFEWSVRKIVFHHLDPVFGKKAGTTRQNLTLPSAQRACAVLLSVLVYSGKQQGISNEEVFSQARDLLGGVDISLLAEKAIDETEATGKTTGAQGLRPLHNSRPADHHGRSGTVPGHSSDSGLPRAAAGCLNRKPGLASPPDEIVPFAVAFVDKPVPQLP